MEVLSDNTIVTTTYGHWTKGPSPYIGNVRLKLSELDELAKRYALNAKYLVLSIVRSLVLPILYWQQG